VGTYLPPSSLNQLLVVKGSTPSQPEFTSCLHEFTAQVGEANQAARLLRLQHRFRLNCTPQAVVVEVYAYRQVCACTEPFIVLDE
jgi:hypothetical protein